MTPQAFSYGTIGPNNKIYIPPYGLNETLNYMLRLDPVSYEIKKIPIEVDDSKEKWVVGKVVGDKIYFLPHDESKVLIVNTLDDSISYISVPGIGKGKYVDGHIYKDKIIALPYGIDCIYDDVLIINTTDDTIETVTLNLDINDEKKWHTTQLINGTIYGMPRGENVLEKYFPYRIEFKCETKKYQLYDLHYLWTQVDESGYASAKFTTLAKYKNKLFAPPYCRNPLFDTMAIYDNGWKYEKTNQTKTSRKYYTNTVSKNGKIYFAPAGHDEDWAELMIVDGETNERKIIDLGIGKESKKYFAGVENSQGKIYYIPRGGCVCEPECDWKRMGDLTEILVIDTADDSTYTIDVSEHFKDNTTIEKYNNCVIVNDKIFAFPYGESEDFQTVLVFDTIEEKVIHTIDLNDI